MTVRAILITDFDGTLTAVDFYYLALDHLISRESTTVFAPARGDRPPTHFEFLARTYAAITVPESEVRRRLADLHPEPRLPELLPRLRAAGWEVIVASAGCDWYIKPLVDSFGLTIHANRGRFVPGRGLVMELPTESPFFDPDIGIDKSAIVRHALEQTPMVAYAGDGPTDVPALRLVAPRWRFARSEAAAILRAQNEPFQPFTRWADVAEQLLAE